MRLARRVWGTMAVAAPAALFLMFWSAGVYGSPRRIFLFASPSLVGGRLAHDLLVGPLLMDVGITAVETATGFIAGCTLGSVIGLLLGMSVEAAKVARVYVVAFGSIPIFAIAPMMIIWFGTGLFAKMVMAALSTLAVAIFQSYEGVRNVDPQLLGLLKTFGASKRQMFFKVVVPSSLVWVLASYKINIGFALLGAFIGEFISSERGLGHYILQGGGLYDVPQILSGVFCIVALSLAMSGAVGLVERRFVPWVRH